MGERLLRFSPVMFTAVTMSAALAHLLELPAKMRYEPSLYVRLHRTLYWNYGRISGVAEILALVSTGGLAWRLRKRRDRAFPFAISAAACLAAAHAAFWRWVSPVNRTMVTWPLDSIPSDWSGWRDQWEYTHAVRAVLVTAALAALVYSLAEESAGRRQLEPEMMRAF
jgi:Domain of unknown function (DUF1772)